MAAETTAKNQSARQIFPSRYRAIVYQALLAAAVIFAAWYLISNAIENLLARRIASGFGFLGREAGFEIGETPLLGYNASDTYLRALAIGLLNTIRVALPAILFSTLIGSAIGLARLASNRLLAHLASAYVEVLRNVPLVVQLFFWYAVITESLPAPADALSPLPGIFLSNRGFAFPTLTADFPFAPDYPTLSGFNFSGGGSLSPEFAALFLGLTLYTAAFIGEIVRAGILAVARGQFEAARSLGLSDRQVMRFIILPQALRVIVPPVTSQYLNCIKNSSLAVAIGYPDLVAIANTAINQTGQAIEGVAIIMLVYLTFSLAISTLMNSYNTYITLRGAK
ncbi:MAG TPA: ABC transporter permease subunit [Candidatus Limnocylindrales bacterium]|nr:ABC transporter permease subunit [Candidatus Limnocylindrales bacterium]